MDELFNVAETERNILRHPYVGTEHFMLAFLKVYGNNFITYDEFKNNVIKIIGTSIKSSEYLLYTPILRKIKEECNNVYECMIRILTDDNSIAYNILLSMGLDIESIYLDVINTNYY